MNGAQGSNPAAAANQALGGAMMMDEISPFPADETVPDQSEDIASIFGLGEEAGPVAGQQPNSSEGATQGGGASPPTGASAAEGGQGQAQPATPATSPQPGQEGTSPQAPAQQQPAAPAAPSAAPAPVTSPAPSQDPNVQALTAQVQALTAHIAQLQGQQGQQGAGSQAPQTGQADEMQQMFQHPLLNYQLAMPDDVAGAVFNEDPAIARQGLTHVINSVGREIHARVLRQVNEVIGQRLQSYGQQSTVQQQQESMRREYFQAFPQHQDPATQLIVAQEAQVLFNTPGTQWDENTRNALGARVNARLGYQQPQQQQPAPQPFGQPAPAQGQPVPTPAAQLGASPRPAASSQDNDSNFIESVLTA